jgi:pyruvate/2-oxoglutarate dehydrogenase complex dihydrolipoamide acyltransferase (E2) component
VELQPSSSPAPAGPRPAPEHAAAPAAERRNPTPVAVGDGAPDRPARAEPAGWDAARRFVGRLARLDHEDAAASIRTWREAMREDGDTWFAAEEAAARALVASGRHAAQKPLLIYIADAFAHRVWYRGRTYLASGTAAAELRVGATEASGQYVATVAMLALLVRDHLDPRAFDVLYRPFAALIPAADLVRE